MAINDLFMNSTFWFLKYHQFEFMTTDLIFFYKFLCFFKNDTCMLIIHCLETRTPYLKNETYY